MAIKKYGVHRHTNRLEYYSETDISAYNGVSQANATELVAEFNNVTTSVSNADSVKLLADAAIGTVQTVRNGTNDAGGGGTTLTVYPPVGEAFENKGTNVGIVINQYSSGNTYGAEVWSFWKISSTLWSAQKSLTQNGVNSDVFIQDNGGIEGNWSIGGRNLQYGGIHAASVATVSAFAGGGQASATNLHFQVSRITTCASDNDSVKMPTAGIVAIPGMILWIINETSQICDVYPQSGGEIDSLGTNNPYSLQPNTGIQVISTSTLNFRTINVVDHDSLAGLTDDDHSQYALLAGRSGGQTIIGGTAASDSLTFDSTSNVTKGKISLGSIVEADQAEDRLNLSASAYTLTGSELTFGDGNNHRYIKITQTPSQEGVFLGYYLSGTLSGAIALDNNAFGLYVDGLMRFFYASPVNSFFLLGDLSTNGIEQSRQRWNVVDVDHDDSPYTIPTSANVPINGGALFSVFMVNPDVGVSPDSVTIQLPPSAGSNSEVLIKNVSLTRDVAISASVGEFIDSKSVIQLPPSGSISIMDTSSVAGSYDWIIKSWF